MIAQLRGKVVHREAGTVVVDVGGVGYLVHVTGGDQVPPRGEPVELHTSLQVREESMTLYGFTERRSLVLFELLLSSSGVGPKLALAALGTHRPDVLRVAIAGADIATLTQVPGIGKKVAERLVLELKDKVAGAGEWEHAPTGTGVPVAAEPSAIAEAREALASLGYSASEVHRALTAIEVADDAATADVLRAALRTLGSGATDGARV